MTAKNPQEQQVVLITGGTDGLGRATAVYLAKHGYRVFAAGRNAQKRAALEQLAREQQLPLEALEMDVCDDASVDRAVGAVEKNAGRIDVLVNNAGLAYIAVMEEIRMDDLRKQFETNFFGVVRVTQRVLPGMRGSSRAGRRIINMSSIAGKFSMPLYGPYSASKHALEGMSDALRLELHGLGIAVVLIEPGYIPTGMADVSVELSSPYVADAAASPYAHIYKSFRSNWKRMASRPQRYTPEDCARVVLRAIRETPPKARYTVTRRAQLLSLAKRWLPDRAMDRRTLRAMGLDQPAVRG